jgi:TM2 domain-containing membrane protein YozV
MAATHKNKTFATLLAAVLGGLGAHRFYLRGPGDALGWLHATSVPAALAVALLAPGQNWFFQILPLTVSWIAACIEALVLGLLPDERWDAAFNGGSGRRSASSWPLALLLVGTLMAGAILLIAFIARLFDLLYTGGAYG